MHAGVAPATWEEATEHELYGRAVARARESGAGGTLPNAPEYLARSEAVDGRYATAAAHATEGLRLARETGQQNSVCHLLASLALIAALQGREDECRSHAAQALDLATARGLGYQSALAEWALARLDLGLGRPAEALTRLAELAVAGPGKSHPFVKLVSSPDLVEAAVRAGQAAAAQAALLEFERFAREAAPPWALALVPRCRGLLTAGDAAERHFLEALHRHGESARPFDRARTELVFGEYLRREGRRTHARAHLRSALDAFERLSAGAWAERARAELRASGETARKRSPRAIDELTPQELQITRLVAEGATNKEVAARLFLSPRTIDYHLRKVFSKLGISSRSELIRSSLEGDRRRGVGAASTRTRLTARLATSPTRAPRTAWDGHCWPRPRRTGPWTSSSSPTSYPKRRSTVVLAPLSSKARRSCAATARATPPSTPCAASRVDIAAGPADRRDGPVRLRQVHAHAHPRRPGQARRRARSRSPASTSPASTTRRSPSCGATTSASSSSSSTCSRCSRRPRTSRCRSSSPAASPDQAWLAELVGKVGLGDRLTHRPAELSGGQQQRVAVARALVSRPSVMFADEPTGNLDSTTGGEILALLRDSVDTLGQTTVMVTHDAHAAAIADRVLFLADGAHRPRPRRRRARTRSWRRSSR